MFSKNVYYGLLILLGAAALLYNKDRLVVGAHQREPTSAASTPQSEPSKVEKFNADAASEAPFKERRKIFLREISNESRNMAKIDERSKETETRLIARARDLTPAEIEILKELSSSKKSSSDEKFLAVFLLGYTAHPAAQNALWSVAREPVSGEFKPDSILYHQELVLRAQALLGLNRQLPEAQRKSEMSAYAENQRELFLSRLAYRLTREPTKASTGP